MSLKSYIIGLAVATLFSWAAWILVLFYIHPDTAGTVGLVAFYVSLFFGLVGLFTLLGFYLRVWFNKNEVIYAHIGISFRQGMLLALAVTGVMLMQALRILTYWDAALFVGSIILVEFYFLSR